MNYNKKLDKSLLFRIKSVPLQLRNNIITIWVNEPL